MTAIKVKMQILFDHIQSSIERDLNELNEAEKTLRTRMENSPFNSTEFKQATDYFLIKYPIEGEPQQAERITQVTADRLDSLINWDNWIEEDEETPMTYEAVIYSRLEWMRERLEAMDESPVLDTDDIEEFKDTIELASIFVTNKPE